VEGFFLKIFQFRAFFKEKSLILSAFILKIPQSAAENRKKSPFQFGGKQRKIG